MPELFPDFVTNRTSFRQAKAFWAQLANEQAAALEQTGEWAPWTQEDEWSDDPELMDGAVVFSLYSATQNKGLRVQQSRLSLQKESAPHVCSWTNVFGEGLLERPIPNLFIGTVPTDENLPLLRRLVRQWFDRHTNKETMQTFINSEARETKG